MPFLTDLDMRHLYKDKYVLLSELKYQVQKSSTTVSVPKGFKTDLASIPRILRSLVTGQDGTQKAAVLHDYLYATKKGKRGWADKIFLDAMQECGVNWLRRRIYWAGVRVGGWVAWND